MQIITYNTIQARHHKQSFAYCEAFCLFHLLGAGLAQTS